MRGTGHSDPIETVAVRHAEANEGEKNGVKRGTGGFFGAKLLKRWGRLLFQGRELAQDFQGYLPPAGPRLENREKKATRVKGL